MLLPQCLHSTVIVHATLTVIYYITCIESSYSSPHKQSTVERILNNAMFNSTDNFYTIKRAFQSQPGTHKICIPVVFNFTCSNQSECGDIDAENYNCSSSGFYKSVLWTEIDTADTAGKLLLYFASSNLNVFGFDWAGACDVPTELVYEPANGYSVPTIKLVVPGSFLCGNYTIIDSEVQRSLLYLTTLVRNYSSTIIAYNIINLYVTANIVSIQDEDEAAGVAESGAEEVGSNYTCRIIAQPY